MADFGPAITAIRECLLGSIGTIRTVTAGDLADGAYASDAAHERARTLTGPRFEVSIEKVEPSSDSPWEHSPVRLLALTVAVRTEITTGFELIDSQRASTRAEMLSLLEESRAALMRGGNLAYTSASASTGIVSGCMHRLISHDLEREDWQGRRLSYISRYRTQIQITQTPG